MSTMKEFLLDWNNFFQENKISEEELRNINETSFRYFLILLLNQLNVETACFELMNQESGTKLRTLRLKLISYANHFLSAMPVKLNYSNLINPSE